MGGAAEGVVAVEAGVGARAAAAAGRRRREVRTALCCVLAIGSAKDLGRRIVSEHEGMQGAG